MENVFSPGPATAARCLFQQLVLNLPKNVGGPDIIGILNCSGWRGSERPIFRKVRNRN